MNRPQALALAVAAANLTLILIFPPYDYLSMQRGNVATFDGFYFVFAAHHNRIVNGSFLALEAIVILINCAIAWLLLNRPGSRPWEHNRLQRGLLWLIAGNLVLMLLFPPFENYASLSRAILPSFEGFHFLFGDNGQRQIVTTILYIELALVLANGSLLWLLFKDRRRLALSADAVAAIARDMRDAQK